MWCRWHLLAAENTEVLHRMMPWLMLVAGVLLVGGVVVYRVKKWMNRKEESAGSAFNLSTIRALHKRGELTDEQYEKIRQKILLTAALPMAKAPPVEKVAVPVDSAAALEAALQEQRLKAAEQRRAAAETVEDLPPLEE